MNDSVRQLLALAREHYARHDHNTADTLLREVVRQDATITDAYHLLGVVQHERGDLTAARESFLRARALDPAHVEAALNLAITCNELGLYTEARTVSNTIATSARAGVRLDALARARLAHQHTETGHAYEELSLFPEAIDEYRKALALVPDLVELRTRVGVALRASGLLQEACAELEASVARHPTYAPALVALGLTYFRLGRREDAARAWKSALEIDPSHRAATVYLRMLEHNEAHLPSIVPGPPTPAPVAPEGDDELANMEVSLLADRGAT